MTATTTTTEATPKTPASNPKSPPGAATLAEWVEAHRLCGAGYQWKSSECRGGPVYECCRCGARFPDDFPSEYLEGGGA